MSEAMTEEKPAIAAAIIVQDGAHLLVQRRVSEGALSGQFPTGAVEAGESLEGAAAREPAGEAGLAVLALNLWGEQINPNTGRLMGYVACAVASGVAHVADTEEFADIAWAAAERFSDYVPYGFAPMVQNYLADVQSGTPGSGGSSVVAERP